MGVVQVQLPDHLKQVIEQQVAEGRLRTKLISSRRLSGFTPKPGSGGRGRRDGQPG